MSDKMNVTPIPNTENGNAVKPGEGSLGNGEQKTEKKKFLLFRWIEAGVEAGKAFVDAVKEHPITSGLLAAGGAVAGGAAVYAVTKANQPQMPQPAAYPPPMIPEGIEEQEEEKIEEESPNAEYVDVPDRD